MASPVMSSCSSDDGGDESLSGSGESVGLTADNGAGVPAAGVADALTGADESTGAAATPPPPQPAAAAAGGAPMHTPSTGKLPHGHKRCPLCRGVIASRLVQCPYVARARQRGGSGACVQKNSRARARGRACSLCGGNSRIVTDKPPRVRVRNAAPVEPRVAPADGGRAARVVRPVARPGMVKSDDLALSDSAPDEGEGGGVGRGASGGGAGARALMVQQLLQQVAPANADPEVQRILGCRPSGPADAGPLAALRRAAAGRPRGGGRPVQYEYLCKFRGQAYVHCKWLSAEGVEEFGTRARQMLKAFCNRRAEALADDSNDEAGEFFDPAFLEVDRILARRDVVVNAMRAPATAAAAPRVELGAEAATVAATAAQADQDVAMDAEGTRLPAAAAPMGDAAAGGGGALAGAEPGSSGATAPARPGAGGGADAAGNAAAASAGANGPAAGSGGAGVSAGAAAAAAGSGHVAARQTQRQYLVKWQNLSYLEATWEDAEGINDVGKISAFEVVNRPPPGIGAFVPPPPCAPGAPRALAAAANGGASYSRSQIMPPIVRDAFLAILQKYGWKQKCVGRARSRAVRAWCDFARARAAWLRRTAGSLAHG